MTRTISIIALTAAALVSTGEETTSPWKLSGYLDFYSIRANPSLDTGSILPFRGYDIRNNAANLTAIQFAAEYAGCKNLPIGFRFSIMQGENQRINIATEPGDANWINWVDEAFLTYTTPDDRFTFDFGKFDTWIGYETKVSGDNDNYSRGLLWTLAQPVYHAGGRASFQVNENLQVGAFAVNGWNEIEDSNNKLSYGGSVAYGRNNWGVRATYFTGEQGDDLGAGGFGTNFIASEKTDVELLDINGAIQVNDKLKIGVNYDHGTGEVDGENYSFNGGALYVNYNINDSLTFGGRAEMFNDEDGLRTGISDLDMRSYTGNLDWKTSENTKVRLEVRHDTANQTVFGRAGGGFGDFQTTWSVSCFVKMP